MIRYDIPNVERSLVILGYEIHHLVEGQFMLMLSILMMVFVGGKKWVWRSSYILTLVGVLFVADEILYYQLIEVSDDAYFELITIISGGVFVLLFLLQLIFQTKIRNKVD